MARKRYLIVGDGAAGITAAETLRRSDSSATIAILTDEPNPGYYRAALTNYLLGELREDQLWCVAADFYDANRIHRILARVTAVDAAARELWDSAGAGPIPYDELLVAAGARPRVPDFDGAHLPGVLTLRTIQDVRKIVDRLRSVKVESAVVLGGGPLGLEWAHGLREHGVKVTIVERGARFMSRVLDEAASHLLMTRLKQAGIDVIFGENVAQAHANSGGSVGAITTHTGRAIRCDLLAVAAGVAANTEFLNGSGVVLREGGAVSVNRRMQSSVPGVWAAGDCASVEGECWQLWEPARLQGRTAAWNMAGQTSLYNQGAFYFATRLFDLDFASVGSTDVSTGSETVVSMPRGTGAIEYRKLVFKEGRLVGALLLGERQARVRAIGRSLKRLIDAAVDVTSVRDKLLNPGFFVDGFLQARKLLEAPPEQAGAPPAAAAKMRGTQLIDFASSIRLKTELLALRPAADGTVALPSSMFAAAPGTALIASHGVPVASDVLEPGGGRGTRVLSIGLHAESPPMQLKPARVIRAELAWGGRRYTIDTLLVRLGQAPECEIRVQDAAVASLHAEIVQSAGALYLRDMGSHTGTWINGQALSSAHKLRDGDRIRIGGAEFVLHAPELGKEDARAVQKANARVPRLEFRSGAAFGLSFALGGEPRIIGRGPDCSIRVDELDVSLCHAQIRGYQNLHYVSDLGSESGTFVTGVRLAPGRELALEENVALRFGSVDAVYTRAALVLQTLMMAPRARLSITAGPQHGESVDLAERTLVGSHAGADWRLSALGASVLEVSRNIRGFWARELGPGGLFRAGAPLGGQYTALSHGDLLLGPGGLMLRFEELE